MFPKSHIILGLLFALILYLVFPSIGIIGASIIFLSSVLIDIDHYLVYVKEKGNLSIKKAFDWHLEKYKQEIKLQRKGIKTKSDFHFLHTIEFHILLVILSFFSIYFFYIFIAFAFHSIVDLIDLARRGIIYRRHYSFILWLIRKD